MFKINEFMIFRKICSSTNIALRIELSTAMGDQPSADDAEEGNDQLADTNETSDASMANSSLNDGIVAVTVGSNADKDSIEAAM